jgi:hypothetical protein
VQQVDSDASAADLGATRTVSAIVELKGLTADDIAAQLVHGVVGPNDELEDTTITPMDLVGLADDHGHYRYETTVELSRAGRYGFTVRVVPHVGRAGPGCLGLSHEPALPVRWFLGSGSRRPATPRASHPYFDVPVRAQPCLTCGATR